MYCVCCTFQNVDLKVSAERGHVTSRLLTYVLSSHSMQHNSP
jgi:hypothetical protein